MLVIEEFKEEGENRDMRSELSGVIVNSRNKNISATQTQGLQRLKEEEEYSKAAGNSYDQCASLGGSPDAEQAPTDP